jgi:hypothetical protein
MSHFFGSRKRISFKFFGRFECTCKGTQCSKRSRWYADDLCVRVILITVAIVTFLKVSVDALDTTCHIGKVALQFCAPKGIRIEGNDLAGRSYRKVVSVRLRQGSLKVLVTSSPEQYVWLEAAHADFDTCLDLYDAAAGWRSAAQAQADFLMAEDAPTGRAESLIPFHGFAERLTLPRGTSFLLSTRFNLKCHLPAVEHHGAGKLYLTELQLPIMPYSQEDALSAGNEFITLPQFSTEDDYFDSDDDERIPEVMRDAQLAWVKTCRSCSSTENLYSNSRLLATIPLPQPSDDSSMSSGDESDNEDLTEPDHPDTDLSESKECELKTSEEDIMIDLVTCQPFAQQL